MLVWGAESLSLHPERAISGTWGAKRWVLHPGGTGGGTLFYQWCHVSSTVLLPDDFVGRIVSSVVSWRAMRNDLDPFLGGVDWIFAI